MDGNIMPTINEIRDMIKEHQEYGYTDISLEIAVALLAEVERLDTDCDRYAGAWKHGQQEIDNLKALVERRDESIDGWIKTLNSCNEELTAAKAEVDRLRDVLTVYADPENWYADYDASPVWGLDNDGFTLAKEALNND